MTLTSRVVERARPGGFQGGAQPQRCPRGRAWGERADARVAAQRGDRIACRGTVPGDDPARQDPGRDQGGEQDRRGGEDGGSRGARPRRAGVAVENVRDE